MHCIRKNRKCYSLRGAEYLCYPRNDNNKKSPKAFGFEEDVDYLALELEKMKEKIAEHNFEMGKTGNSSMGEITRQDDRIAFLQTSIAKNIMLERHKGKTIDRK